ncbi:MAG: glycosyltransferase [Bacteroidales bacterium]|nr:glycosyltransferase [Bacteroidales bacterium]
MKILQLGKFYPIRGGVEKVMWDLTRGLSQTGVACDMLCAWLPGEGIDAKDESIYHKDDNYLEFPEGGRVWLIPALSKKAATMLAPKMVGWLRRHASEYDLIDIHHPDPMAALALLLSGFKGRVVLHWHSDIVSQKFFLFFYKPLQKWLIRRAERIIGTTPAYLGSSPFLKDVQNKCTAVPIGIDPVRFNEAMAQDLHNKHNGSVLLLSVGRLVPYKGFPYLIESMSLLPDYFHLLLIGEGPMRPKLEADIARLGLESRVTMAGYADDAQLTASFGACDIFVLPSIYKTEAFGIVQLEAMSCGKPVVATRIPGSGTAWVNSDGVSGRNAEPENPSSLADAILAVYENRASYADGARKRYEECFTKEIMIQKTINIYDSI